MRLETGTLGRGDVSVIEVNLLSDLMSIWGVVVSLARYAIMRTNLVSFADHKTCMLSALFTSLSLGSSVTGTDSS